MKITSPEHAYRFFRGRFREDVEEVWTLGLTSEKDVLATEMVFRGTVDACMFHPREIFRFALKHNASSLIVAHNHPTGVAYPSKQDLKITKRLMKASRVIEIAIEDHLILAGTSFYSFLKDGKL